MPKLAKPGDPLVHGLGKIEMAEPVERDRSLVEQRLVNTTPVIREYQPKNRRSLKELPADPQTQTVLNAVMVFSIQGLTSNEIAVTLNTTIKEIESIKAMPAYQETFEMVFKEFINANSNSLQARIASYAASAVENVFDIADAELGDKAVPAIVKLKANQDILDRSGLSSDALFGRADDDEAGNSLHIEVTSAESNTTTVKVDIGRKGKR